MIAILKGKCKCAAVILLVLFSFSVCNTISASAQVVEPTLQPTPTPVPQDSWHRERDISYDFENTNLALIRYELDSFSNLTGFLSDLRGFQVPDYGVDNPNYSNTGLALTEAFDNSYSYQMCGNLFHHAYPPNAGAHTYRLNWSGDSNSIIRGFPVTGHNRLNASIETTTTEAFGFSIRNFRATRIPRTGNFQSVPIVAFGNQSNIRGPSTITDGMLLVLLSRPSERTVRLETSTIISSVIARNSGTQPIISYADLEGGLNIVVDAVIPSTGVDNTYTITVTSAEDPTITYGDPLVITNTLIRRTRLYGVHIGGAYLNTVSTSLRNHYTDFVWYADSLALRGGGFTSEIDFLNKGLSLIHI